MRINIVSIIAFALVIIGALNWGLVGFFDLDVVAALLGEMSLASRAVYALVGLAGVYLLIDRLTAPTPVDHDKGTTAASTTGGNTTDSRGSTGTHGR